MLENVKDYHGQHSVTFTINGVTRNTWTDWGLVPSSRHSEPINGIWSQKVTVGGVNGEEDLVRTYPYNAVNSYYKLRSAIENDNRDGIKSESGYDIFQPSSGSLSFIIADQDTSFCAKEQEILNFLHSRSGSMIFADDPSKVFQVRITVGSFSSSEKYSGLSISYYVLSEN